MLDRAPRRLTLGRAPRLTRVVALEARRHRRRHARLHEHALGRVLAHQVARDFVQLGEAVALAVGQQQLDVAQRAGELRLDPLAQLLEPLAGERRDEQAVGVAQAQSSRASSSSASALLSTSRRGRSPAPISSSTSSTARIISSSSSSGAEASTTCSSRSASARLLQRRAERVDELVGQLADEADGVGQQVVAPAEPPAARRRVERVEQPVAHADLGARERVEQRRLAGVRVADERDLGQLRARRARRASFCARPSRAPGGVCSAVMRSRARRRSVSICDSPGPRVPMPGPPAGPPAPAPRRSRWVHSPRMRARLYSSCASSTCSLPSAECACPAKMSRMIAVRSTTGHAERLLEVAPLARRELVVAGDDVRVLRLDRRSQLLQLARARSTCSGAACSRCWTICPTVATPAVRSSSSQLGQVLAGLQRRRSPAHADARARRAARCAPASASRGRCGLSQSSHV